MGCGERSHTYFRVTKECRGAILHITQVAIWSSIVQRGERKKFPWPAAPRKREAAWIPFLVCAQCQVSHDL